MSAKPALTPRESVVLSLLRKYSEGCKETDDRGEWLSIYLDNARPDDMTPRQFAGVLSSLEKKGFYRSGGDDCFGDVLGAEVISS